MTLLSSLTHAATRGVWLTTLSGLDWPAGIHNPAAQRQQLCDMLDSLSKAHINLVVFQVQAAGEVAWDSAHLPALSSVTGGYGRQLPYDLCRFVIDECHARSMECHAWVIPFKLNSARRGSRPTAARPELCVKHQGTYYLDPGLPATTDYLLEVYRELISQYDFDGINFDYTRYPDSNFPDKKSFADHNHNRLPLADWRRDNINRFMAAAYNMVKDLRPDMIVGSAPIGTYKNVKHYRNTTAFDSFQQDPAQWIASGHHDMIIPQMYWDEEFGFSDHLTTWVDSVAQGRRTIIGLAPYKILEKGWTAQTVIDLMTTASQRPGVDGVCFFRASHILGVDPRVRKLYDYLVNHP